MFVVEGLGWSCPSRSLPCSRWKASASSATSPYNCSSSASLPRPSSRSVARQKRLCCLHVCPLLQMTPGPGLRDSQQPVPASQARATWLSLRQGEQTPGQPSQSARGWCSDRGAFGGHVVRGPGAIKVGSAMSSSQAANLILPLRVPTRNGGGDKEGKGGRSLEGRRWGEGHLLSQALSWALLAVGLT